MPELQRRRLLDAAVAVVAEQGYRGMAVRRVSERAGVSSKTFYDLFTDREDCFLAAFGYAIERLVSRARPVYEAERDWVGGVRGGLGELLGFLDGEPALGRLVFVEALGVGPRVLARRSEVIQDLVRIVDRGRVGVKGAEDLPPLTGEGIVGAALGVIHTRLSEQPDEPLRGLLGALMATIVLPYRGRAAAARELTRPAPQAASPGGDRSADGLARPLGQLAPVDFRMTVRTQMVLAAIAQLEARGVNPSNREVSEEAGIADQGQISRLMMRLAEQHLAENTRGAGNAKAWRLTRHGEQAVQANSPTELNRSQPAQQISAISTKEQR